MWFVLHNETAVFNINSTIVLLQNSPHTKFQVFRPKKTWAYMQHFHRDQPLSVENLNPPSTALDKRLGLALTPSVFSSHQECISAETCATTQGVPGLLFMLHSSTAVFLVPRPLDWSKPTYFKKKKKTVLYLPIAWSSSSEDPWEGKWEGKSQRSTSPAVACFLILAGTLIPSELSPQQECHP